MHTFRRLAWVTFCVAVATGVAVGTPTTIQAVEQGASAPQIEFAALSGQPVSLRALRGRVVVVDFWASWCKPCRKELPVLDALYRKYRSRGLSVIAVNIDDDAQAARSFLKKVPVEFPVVHDPAKKIAAAYGVPDMPSSYVIDQQGTIRHVQVGFRAKDEAVLVGAIERLLK